MQNSKGVVKATPFHKERQNTMINKLKRQWQYHVMLVPGIIILLIFSYYPLYGLVIAFQDYNPGLGFHSKWVGLDNFKYVFSQPGFLRTIGNTLYIAIFKIIGGIVVPVTFALLLNEVASDKLKRVFQTLVYLPHFMSWVILAGVLTDILGSDGLVNEVINRLGLESINFLGSVKIFPWTVIISDIWKDFGFGTIIYLAALTSIDPGLYESAMIDGAGRWKQTLYITLPMLAPTIILKSVLSLGGVLDAGFDQIYNMYAPIVYESGDIIDTYVYRLGIRQAQYSVATAVGLFKSLVSSILVGLSYILADKLAGYRIF